MPTFMHLHNETNRVYWWEPKERKSLQSRYGKGSCMKTKCCEMMWNVKSQKKTWLTNKDICNIHLVHSMVQLSSNYRHVPHSAKQFSSFVPPIVVFWSHGATATTHWNPIDKEHCGYSHWRPCRFLKPLTLGPQSSKQVNTDTTVTSSPTRACSLTRSPRRSPSRAPTYTFARPEIRPHFVALCSLIFERAY